MPDRCVTIIKRLEQLVVSYNIIFLSHLAFALCLVSTAAVRISNREMFLDSNHASYNTLFQQFPFWLGPITIELRSNVASQIYTLAFPKRIVQNDIGLFYKRICKVPSRHSLIIIYSLVKRRLYKQHSGLNSKTDIETGDNRPERNSGLNFMLTAILPIGPLMKQSDCDRQIRNLIGFRGLLCNYR